VDGSTAASATPTAVYNSSKSGATEDGRSHPAPLGLAAWGTGLAWGRRKCPAVSWLQHECDITVARFLLISRDLRLQQRRKAGGRLKRSTIDSYPQFSPPSRWMGVGQGLRGSTTAPRGRDKVCQCRYTCCGPVGRADRRRLGARANPDVHGTTVSIETIITARAHQRTGLIPGIDHALVPTESRVGGREDGRPVLAEGCASPSFNQAERVGALPVWFRWGRSVVWKARFRSGVARARRDRVTGAAGDGGGVCGPVLEKTPSYEDEDIRRGAYHVREMESHIGTGESMPVRHDGSGLCLGEWKP
jgi:hypothetical protein